MMGVKQETVLLLLEKIKELLGSLPEGDKKGEKFLEAEKALKKLNELLSGEEGRELLRACKAKMPPY
jgi:hypothetical protein